MLEYDFPEVLFAHLIITAVSLTNKLFHKDVERLPEGFKRIGYDSDTAKFTFRDGNGQLYQSEAGADYGILTPMSAALSSSRPNAFSSDSGAFLRSPFSTQITHPLCPPSDLSSTPPPPTHYKEKSTFQDFLHPDSIATTPLSPKKSLTPVCSFKTSKSLLPKMQDVVHELRRSVTSIHRTPPKFPDEMRKLECEETQRLIQCDSSSSSETLVVPGATTRRSKTIATSRPRSGYF